MKYGFVYIWRDRKYKRFYIGSHWGTKEDGYVCSSTWMRQAYSYRPEDFKRRILTEVYTSRKDLLEMEQHWFNMIKPEEIRHRYYNLNIKTTAHWSAKENALTVAQKISRANKGNKSINAGKWKKGQRSNIKREFKIGELPHNAGKSYDEYYGIEKSKNVKEKMSLAKKGNPSNSPTKFKEGVKPWNTGLKRIMINNGVQTKYFLEDVKMIPDGWKRGCAPKIKMSI